MILRKKYNDSILSISTKNSTMISICSKKCNKMGFPDKLICLFKVNTSYIRHNIIPKIDIDLHTDVGYCLNVFWLNLHLITWL